MGDVTVREKGSLAAALAGEEGALLDRAIDLYQASTVRLPGASNLPLARRVAAPIVEALAEAFSGDQLAPGSPELRELEKSVGFVASSWAADRGSGFDLTGVLLAVREALYERADDVDRQRLASLFDWLFALSADAFGYGGVRAEKERLRQTLERGMPVVAVTPDLPAAFLVGESDSYTLDGVLGRLAMLVIRLGARSAIIDATGLDDASAAPALVSLDRFLRHRKLAGKLTILVVGLPSEAEPRWADVAATAGTSLEVLPSFDQAVARGLERSEHRLIRRPS